VDKASLETRLLEIEARNTRVEGDKSWETSFVRRGTIAGITYVCAFTFMKLMGLAPAHIGAFVPVGGYLLSTLGLPFVRRWAGY